MNTLKTLLHLTPDRPRRRGWAIAALIVWGLVYLIAIVGAGMKFVN